ncbi:MAG: hypothetical protein C0478_06720 [Planctomyces sp.]|nr:hypothetical protein [Planctomyces sp.]
MLHKGWTKMIANSDVSTPWRRRGQARFLILLSTAILFMLSAWWWAHIQIENRKLWLTAAPSPEAPLQFVRFADFPIGETGKAIHGFLGTKADYLPVDREADVPRILQAARYAPSCLIVVFGHDVPSDSTRKVERALPHAVFVWSQ